jgi:hypothetical protein
MNTNKISHILTKRKNDELDKAILRAGISGIIGLIEDNDYKLSEVQAKAIAEYLKRFYETSKIN